MEWVGSRTDVHEFYRVDYPTFAEMEQLFCFEDGGTVTYSQFTSVGVSARLDALDMPDLGNDMVRIYVKVTDSHGETVREPIATMFPTSPKRRHGLSHEKCSVDLYGTLYLLQCRKTRSAVTIPSGTVAVTKAAAMVAEVGLPVIADASAAALNSDMTFDALTPYITIVNELLQFAGFNSVYSDGNGNAIMRKYINPNGLSPRYTWTAGQGCAFSDGLQHELDTWDVPNAYTVVYSPIDGTPDSATATNDDPNSRTSTVSRGYVVDDGETVSDVEDHAALVAIAQRRLQEQLSKVESCYLEHLWVPMNMGDVVSVNDGLLSVTASACNMDVTLGRGTICSTRIRRFVNV